MLTRRELLLLAGSGAGALAYGCGSKGSGGLILPPPAPAFPPSLMNPSRREVELELAVIDGQLPRDIEGHAFIAAALPYMDGTSILIGDGMIYRLSFSAKAARLKTRLMRTDDLLVDHAATDPELAFKTTGFVRSSPAFGARNFDNTALLPIMDGRLLVVSDPGRPWEIDPVTLEPISPIGHLSEWQAFAPIFATQFFPLLMGSAHPVFDPAERKIYLVNFAPGVEGTTFEHFTRVMVWDGVGDPVATTILDAQGQPAHLEQSCHQIQTTRRYVVLSDGAVRVEPEQFSDPDFVLPQRPTSVLWVIAKADLVPGGTATARRIEIPLESSHFLIEEGDDADRMTVVLCHQNSSDPSEWVRANDRVFSTGAPVDPATVGMLVAQADATVMGRYTIDLSTGAVTGSSLLADDRLWGYTLWSQDVRSPRARIGDAFWGTLGFDPQLLTQRIADVYASHPYRQLPLSELPKAPRPPQLLRIDHDSTRVTDSFALPLGHLPQSPVFMPRKNGGPNDGYILSFVVQPDQHELWIWSATDLAHGPICRLRHPDLHVGFMLHSAWVPDLVSQASPAYAVDRRQDYGERTARLSPKARALVENVLGVES